MKRLILNFLVVIGVTIFTYLGITNIVETRVMSTSVYLTIVGMFTMFLMSIMYMIEYLDNERLREEAGK